MNQKRSASGSSIDKAKNSVPYTRRRALQGCGVAVTAGLAGCLGGDDGPDNEPDITIIGIDGGLNTLALLYGNDNGVWSDRDLDVNIELGDVGRWRRCFLEQECTGFGTQDAFDLPNDLEQVEVRNFGGGLAEINRVFVRDDSDIEEPPDLEDKVFAATGLGSGTAQAFRAYWLDEYNFDLMEDTAEAIDAGGNQIYNELVDGEIDAGLMYTGFTISGLVDDQLRSISYFADGMRDRIGKTPQVVFLTTFADYLDENPEDVKAFWEGWLEALDLWEENFEEAIEQFGPEAGVDLDSQEEYDEIERHLQEEELFPRIWDDEWIDAHIELYEFLADTGAVDSVPDRDVFVNPEEL